MRLNANGGLGSANQGGNGSLVGWVDSLQSTNLVEGAIGGEDGVDSTIECERCEDGIAGIDFRVSLEDVNSALHVIGFEWVQPDELGDVTGGPCRIPPISRPAQPLMG